MTRNPNRTLVFATVIAAATALSPLAASAQSRSLIPAETLEVMLQRQDTLFTRMDLNRDGAISSTEIQVAMAQLRNQAGQGGAGQGGARQGGGMGGDIASLGMLLAFAGPPPQGRAPAGEGGPAGGAGPQGGVRPQGGSRPQGEAGPPRGPGGGQVQRMQFDPAQFAERVIQALDKDGDNQISRAEMRAATEARFKMMDRNGDGVQSEDEQPRLRYQGAPGGQQGGGMTPPMDIPSGDGGF